MDFSTAERNIMLVQFARAPINEPCVLRYRGRFVLHFADATGVWRSRGF